MKHKYLHELFSDGKLPFPYSEEDYHDFDKRDTYSMDYTLIAWFYERLRYFQDEVSKTVDLNDGPLYMFGKKVVVDGLEVTLGQCISRMIVDCEVILIVLYQIEEDWEAADAAKNDLFMVLSKVYWAMWW